MKDNLKEEIAAAEKQEKTIGVIVVPEEPGREDKLKERVDFYIEHFRTMTEKEFRDIEPYDEPKARTIEDLSALITSLVERSHDYGTCVYAMTYSALAAFDYVAHKLGVTGFQASCADATFLARTRGMNDGFSILDYNKLLYPQFLDKFNKTATDYIYSNLESLQDKVLDFLEEKEGQVHPDVKAHWEWILSLKPKEMKE